MRTTLFLFSICIVTPLRLCSRRCCAVSSNELFFAVSPLGFCIYVEPTATLDRIIVVVNNSNENCEEDVDNVSDCDN